MRITATHIKAMHITGTGTGTRISTSRPIIIPLRHHESPITRGR
jgi:hypothetical protein